MLLRSFFLLSTLISLSSHAVEKSEVQAGLKLLFKNVKCEDQRFCPNEANLELMTQNALDFKQKFDSHLTNQVTNIKWKKIGYSSQEVEFDSLMQRENNHPSNKVKAVVHFPTPQYGCDDTYPATILIHKLGNNFESEMQIAEMATSSKRGIVMVIYLPHFGPRKAAENFITKNPEDFEQNILQSLLDIHQANLVLKTLPNVKKDDLGLMGLSLGAMVSLISAGIDPIFQRYATNVGGGDLANIVTYRKSGDVDSQTGQALKEVTWGVDEARFNLSKFDAITWSTQVRNKSITMINSISDELISKPTSIDPLVEGYRVAGSNVNLVMHKGTHVFRFKEVGFWQSLTKVLLPMMNFIGTSSSLNCTSL
jgi:hypothetical protein